jgi:stearoyl-CoA desaturase (Delta-9 desaturase)
MNATTAFIDFFAKIGWAYDLKTVSKEIIQKRIERTGDGTHPHSANTEHLWGYGDKEQDAEEREMIPILNKKSE